MANVPLFHHLRAIRPVAFLLGASLAVSACGSGSSGKISVATNPDVVNAAGKAEPKDSSTCLEPAKVLAGVEYTCADGKKRKGMFLAESLPACMKDGDVGCVATSRFKAADTQIAMPGVIKSGVTIAGVAGTLTFQGPANCAADGETGCVSTASFPAVDKSLLTPGVLKSGVAVAGVAGAYPSAAFPLAGADAAVADLTDLSPALAAGTYEFFDSAGVRKTGQIVDQGVVTPGLADQTISPSAGLMRSVVVKGDANLLAVNIASGVNILGVAGSAVLKPADCSAEGSVGCVTTASYKSATISGLAAKVLSTASVAGETGTVVLPGAGDVRSGVAFGAASALSGSYSPDFPDVANVRSTDTVNGAAGTLANCSTDGATGCVAVTAFPAADTSNFTGWDIRRKRNQTTGAVLTFAGIASQGKSHCRNRANRTLFDNGTAPATASTLDVFDTIDDYNNNLTGLPGEIPAWTIINSTNYGADFACGGIYATGNTATGNTGADASLAHDPNGNWQDLTPGILPGGSNSTNPANGCNASDKHCVFRELISGLMVTEVSATTYTWANAISYCHNLGEAGGAVTSPIPVIGGATYSDWRLPTQKELMQIYQGGVRGLNQTSNLTTFFGDVDTWFWSSSSVSDGASYAWTVNLDHGYTGYNAKTFSGSIVCVR